MKLIVTGAAGFIGSNIVGALNAAGHDDIIAVDELSDAAKADNLAGLRIADYLDKDEFAVRFAQGDFADTDVIFHQGACSDTMEQDGRYMMRNNYAYSRGLLDGCLESGTRLIYASSAAVYGGATAFAPVPANERPLNVYGYSKLLFDQLVRRGLPGTQSQVAGLRYFNVYGPGEAHKGRMASVAFHHFHQFAAEGHVRLFGAYDGRAAGEQQRDFIFVDDIVRVNMWLLERPAVSGVFNLGTGSASSFNALAHAMINALLPEPLELAEQVELGLLRYVDFPEALKGKYQSYTCADMTGLREAGYAEPFVPVAEGVARYARSLA
jgi:ADP-L-glycero-D-manno-heptose 6-epimerase